jgi:hypothetical protein
MKELQLNIEHFPTLMNVKVSEKQCTKYANKMTDLLQQYLKTFGDIHTHSEAIEQFSFPFHVNVDRILKIFKQKQLTFYAAVASEKI